MFITAAQASRGPADDFWYGPVASTSLAGPVVSSDSAMRLSTVYKCVRVRAETIGMLPLMVYRRLPDGGKEAATDHPLYRLLHDAPNPWMTSAQFRQCLQAHVDLRGNGYAQIVLDGAGREDMLIPLASDRMRVTIQPDGRPRYEYTRPNGSAQVFVWGEVLHVAGFTLDGYCGVNPIEAEREAIGSAIAARDYGARYFGQSVRAPMWVKMAGKFDTDDSRRRWVNDFSAAFGGINAGRVPVMEAGKELVPIPTLNNADAQFIESRKYADVDIAGLFRMPPHKIGILDRATWGNIEHQQLDFVTDTIMPACVAWEQCLLRDLDFGDGYFAEHKLSGLLRGDTRTRFEAYGKGIQDGWLTRNEARSMENMNRIDGLDEPLQPLNMTPVGQPPAAAAPSASAWAHGPAHGPASGERRHAVLMASVERAARKETALARRANGDAAKLPTLFEGHARWLAEVLAVAPERAQAHVEATIDRARQALQAKTTVDDFAADQSLALMRLLEL